MISEKNAQKREEAAATAALCATKPIFTKIGHGMDYLQETVRQTQKANLKQAAVVNQRQYETERYVGKLIEEQDTVRQSIETSKKNSTGSKYQTRTAPIQHRAKNNAEVSKLWCHNIAGTDCVSPLWKHFGCISLRSSKIRHKP